MPFSNPKKIINKHCVSLQVTGLDKRYNNSLLKKMPKRKRVFLFISRGSVTIEATLSITIFMIVVISLSSFLVMLYGQLSIEEKINNISMETAKAKYFIRYNKEESEKYKQIAEKGYISARVFGTIDNNGTIINGLNPTQSKMENGYVDVILSYNVKIPFADKKWIVTQRAKTKDWTGVDLTDPQEIVYITKYGTVYHKSKECKHLIISIKEVSYKMSQLMRNQSGHKYKRCSYCARGLLTDNSSVFITTDGDRYHTRLDCGGLTRNIIEIDIKDVGDKRPCSSCGG